jgi:D-alanine--poly(phosphoribitol) ligase subunit 2
MGPHHTVALMSIAERVLATLAEVAEYDEVRTDLGIRLFDTHMLDSIRTVELIMLLSDRLGIDISPAEFDRERWATPGKIVAYFEGRMAS